MFERRTNEGLFASKNFRFENIQRLEQISPT